MVSDAYNDLGLMIFMIIRKQPGGRYMIANFVVDRCCLGVKNAFANCNLEESEVEELTVQISENRPVEEDDEEGFFDVEF